MSRRALHLGAVAVAVALAGGAAAFVRTTSVRLRPDQGLCLWWSPRQVHYVVNMSGLTGQGCASAAEASTLAQGAFTTWGQATRSGAAGACTDLHFTHDGETGATDVGFDPATLATNENLVVMRTGPCSDTTLVPANDPCHDAVGACAATYGCWEHGTGSVAASTLALTTVTFRSDTGEIVDADVELNGWSGNGGAAQNGSAGWYYTCAGPGQATCSNPPYGQSSCNWIDVGSTLVHEVGHVIGLDHVCVASYPPPFNACPTPAPVMVATASFGDTAKRALSPDDVEAICTIYPAGAATKTCVPPPAQRPSGGGGGCSTAGGTPAALVLVALLLRWRRRG